MPCCPSGKDYGGHGRGGGTPRSCVRIWGEQEARGGCSLEKVIGERRDQFQGVYNFSNYFKYKFFFPFFPQILNKSHVCVRTASDVDIRVCWGKAPLRTWKRHMWGYFPKIIIINKSEETYPLKRKMKNSHKRRRQQHQIRQLQFKFPVFHLLNVAE